jgi:hypothetical protein
MKGVCMEMIKMSDVPGVDRRGAGRGNGLFLFLFETLPWPLSELREGSYRVRVYVLSGMRRKFFFHKGYLQPAGFLKKSTLLPDG